VGRLTLFPEYEFGVSENPLDHHFDPAIESSVVAPLLIETHQRFKVLSVGGPAERSPGQGGHDLPRTRCFFVGTDRTAHKDLAPAGRVTGALGVERTVDAHTGDVREEAESGNPAGLNGGPHEVLVVVVDG